jgi:outer membrane protein OmpA-like peptidoglycan-associated protein
MKCSKLSAVSLVLLSVCLFAAPQPVIADEYDESQSHPLRVVGYVAHPVGVLLEWIAARPFHFLVSGSPEAEYVFGHRPHPPMFAEAQPAYNFGVLKRKPMQAIEAPKRVVRAEPVAERVSVKEVTVEKTVLKEVPKIVEVERVVFPDVAFEFNRSRLTDLGKGKVYLVAQKLKEKSDVVVAIEGHADYIGSEEYNQKLGLRRAETVMKELAALGIEASRMSVASFGETKPAIDVQTDWARAVNRRVEFRVAAP